MRLAIALASELSVHFSRFAVTQISDEPESRGQFSLGAMLDAVRLLKDARVDAYLWSGTSGSWLGLEHDEQLVAAIAAETGKPATTSSLSLAGGVPCAQRTPLRIGGPLRDLDQRRHRAHLGRRRIRLHRRARGGLTTNWDFASVSAAAIVDDARRVARSEPDAVVIHCTNMRGGEVVEQIESELGMPVLDSVVVGLWGALRLLSIETPAAGFGALARLGRARPRAGLAWLSVATLIRGASIVTDAGAAVADLAIGADGRISAVGDPVRSGPKSWCRADGLFAIPGGLDLHVHINTWFGGTTTRDDFLQGTRAALFGGTTTIAQFAIPRPGETSMAAVTRT